MSLTKLLAKPLVLGLTCLAFLSGCTAKDEATQIDEQIKRFHTLYNQEQYDKMYTTLAHAEYRQNVSVDKHQLLFASIQKIMGPFEYAEVTQSQKILQNDRTIVTITLKSHFAKGEATETLSYLPEEAYQLLIYHLNSDEMNRLDEETYQKLAN